MPLALSEHLRVVSAQIAWQRVLHCTAVRPYCMEAGRISRNLSTGVRMATSEPLPQRTMHKSRRLRGQEPLSPSSPERVVRECRHGHLRGAAP